MNINIHYHGESILYLGLKLPFFKEEKVLFSPFFITTAKDKANHTKINKLMSKNVLIFLRSAN